MGKERAESEREKERVCARERTGEVIRCIRERGDTTSDRGDFWA